MNKFEIGETVEYHPSKWMQESAGCKPIELVNITCIDHDGGIGYENEAHRGHIG